MTTSFEVELSVEENGKKAPKYTLETDLYGEVTLMDLLEYMRSALIITADFVLKEEQALGFDKKPLTLVDGSELKPIESVKPFGKIEHIAKTNLADIVLAAYASISQRSPVFTGRYKSSNFVFLNNTQIATDQASLEAWINSSPTILDTDVIQFVNIQPYARKLERQGVRAGKEGGNIGRTRQRKGRRGNAILLPNGAYFLTARVIASKYKNVRVKFNFIPGTQISVVGSFQKAVRGSGRPYLYPSVSISVKKGGY